MTLHVKSNAERVNIKELHSKLKLHVSVTYGRHVAQLRRRRRRAYAPASKTASHDNHEKSNHGFPFLSPMSMGLRLGVLRAPGAPLKIQLVSVSKIIVDTH